MLLNDFTINYEYCEYNVCVAFEIIGNVGGM